MSSESEGAISKANITSRSGSSVALGEGRKHRHGCAALLEGSDVLHVGGGEHFELRVSVEIRNPDCVAIESPAVAHAFCRRLREVGQCVALVVQQIEQRFRQTFQTGSNFSLTNG
jgi:hypothetical protein